MAFAYHAGALCAEDVSLEEIARRFGTPCYVYSRAVIEANFERFSNALAGRKSLIAYSVKANSNLAVLDLMARLGAGFDIVSGGELVRVLAAGGDPRKVVFSGVGKKREEMALALDAGTSSDTTSESVDSRALASNGFVMKSSAPASSALIFS